MKTKKYVSLFLAVLMLCGILAGCGASSKTDSIAMEGAAEAPASANTAYGAMSNGTTGAEGSTALPENRKWIITVNMNAETDDLDALTAALDEKITALNGYVEDQSVYNGSSYANYRYRNASMTIRIPADDVDNFTDEVGGIANVVSKSKTLEDITLKYVATESRISALETEEARLLEFMEKAETMSDLLEIEERLTEVRAELESTTSQMRLYNNQIDYATIYLSIEEVQEYTPVEEPTFWERITDGFSDNLKGLGEGLVDLLVWIITTSPYLVVLGVTALIVVLLGKRVGDRFLVEATPTYSYYVQVRSITKDEDDGSAPIL